MENMLDRERELAWRLKEAKEKKNRIETEFDLAKEELLKVENEIIELFDDQGKTSVKYDGIGRITIPQGRILASFIEGQEDIAMSAIEKIGRGDMIKRSIHPGTLSTFVKNQIENNEPIPEGITYYERRWTQFTPEKKSA